jgi:acetyltransferase (GNAT) family protein
VDFRDGVMACATGIPTPGLNGVWCSRRDPDPAEIRRLLGELSSRGLPHMLQLRPGGEQAAAAVPEEEGLTRADDMPLMRLDEPAALERALAAAPGLDIRRLGPEDGDLHARTAASGFGEKPEHFVRLLPPPVMGADGVRAYAGEVDGEIVTTALGVAREDYVAVFNVGTPAEHRRRGYGAAITARVVLDGLADGASWAWLQSSPAGHRLYEALGFRTLERWLCWVRL